MEKENKKSELEKELVYKRIYLPVRFFKKEAYIHIDDYKEAISKRENAVNGLEEENKKLKSDLAECECSMHFENDEVGFWKREYKRLKKWIKDHCNGYGNLFPEDEMKRQRKKADKKRKKTKEDDELIYEEGLYD